MSDVVNRRKQIAKDGRRATIHDWLKEKEGEIDFETFECVNFLKMLSQLHFKLGHFDTAGVCGDEIRLGTKVDSFPMFSTYFLNPIWGPLSVNMPPGSVQTRQRPSGKCGCCKKKKTANLPIGLISDQAACCRRGRALSHIRRLHLRSRVCMVE